MIEKSGRSDNFLSQFSCLFNKNVTKINSDLKILKTHKQTKDRASNVLWIFDKRFYVGYKYIVNFSTIN